MHFPTHKLILAMWFVWCLPSQARAAPENGEDLMRIVFNRSGWDDMQGDVRLEITNKSGDTKSRRISLWSRKNSKNETSMLMRFVAPADVRGTGFLLIEHDNGEDDRRLFMPALRRVQRISASGSGGNFMSSDFTYYDIGRPELSDWTYRLGEERETDGTKCRIVEGTASSDKVKEDTGYGKIVWCVDERRMVIKEAEYFDEHGRPHKRLDILRIEDVSGSPFATHLRMTDLDTGSRSEMEFDNLQTNKGLDDNTFSERNLRRWTR